MYFLIRNKEVHVKSIREKYFEMTVVVPHWVLWHHRSPARTIKEITGSLIAEVIVRSVTRRFIKGCYWAIKLLSRPLILAQRLGKHLPLCHNRSVLLIQLKRVHTAKNIGLSNSWHQGETAASGTMWNHQIVLISQYTEKTQD